MPERLRNAEKYCLARSWRLRRCPGYTSYLVRNALNELPPKPPKNKEIIKAWENRLRERLKEAVQNDYKIPLAAFVLLHIISPIVIRLVIEWWLSRWQSCKSGCCMRQGLTEEGAKEFMQKCDGLLKKVLEM